MSIYAPRVISHFLDIQYKVGEGGGVKYVFLGLPRQQKQIGDSVLFLCLLASIEESRGPPKIRVTIA
jgi:hypothetical protein